MVADDADYELARIRFRKLYKKAKELNLSDEDIRKLEICQKYKEKKLNLVSLICKWSFITVFTVATLILSLYIAVQYKFLDAKTIAVWSTWFTKVDLEQDQCLYPFSESLLDLARPPVNCSFCKGVTGFERVSNLSSKRFVEEYAYSGRPVIITDAARNWTALKTFSFDYLKSIYNKDSPVFSEEGQSKGCQFFPYKTKFNGLEDVFKMSNKMRDMKGAPWYIGWSNCDPQAANILREHYERPYFLSTEMESSRTDWIFMGTPGYGAHIHIDAVQQSSWQAQIQGDKEWILEPPPECYYECTGGRFRDTIRPGEVVVLDTNRWFHGTNVVGKKLSIVIGSEYD